MTRCSRFLFPVTALGSTANIMSATRNMRRRGTYCLVLIRLSAVCGAPRDDSAQLHALRGGRFGYSDLKSACVYHLELVPRSAFTECLILGHAGQSSRIDDCLFRIQE